MPRLRIPKNAGKFKIGRSMILTYIVANGKSGGNRVIIPCKSREQAEKLCRKLNEKDRPEEIWF